MPLFCSRPSTRTRVRSEPLAAALKEQDERIKELEAEVAALGRAVHLTSDVSQGEQAVRTVHPASGASQGEQAVRTSMVDDRSSALEGDAPKERLEALTTAYQRLLQEESANLSAISRSSLVAMSRDGLNGCSRADAEPRDVFDCHLTGLVDSQDLPTLRIALLDAAGGGGGGAGRDFDADDPSTWCDERLRRLDADSLVALRRTLGGGAGAGLPINQPLSIISLLDEQGQPRHGGQDISTFFFPFDKHALTHSKDAINDFVLLASAFDSPTPHNSRERLAALREHLWPKEASPMHTLRVSPLHCLTLPDAARARAGIPTHAAFYAFCHPPDASSEAEGGSVTAKAAEEAAAVERTATKVVPGLAASDPLVAWLLTGAYVYFDYKYDIVAVNAISFSPEGGSSALFLGPACPLPATAIEPLFDGQRWRRLPAAVAAAGLGFARMAWVTPSEFLGDTIYSKSGGLALLHEDDIDRLEDVSKDGRFDVVRTTRKGRSRYFPIVRNEPLLEHPTIRLREGGKSKPLAVKRALLHAWPPEDGLAAVRHFASTFADARMRPTPYIAPLFIHEISSQRGAAVGAARSAKFIEPTQATFDEGRSAAVGLEKALVKEGFDFDARCDLLGVTEKAALEKWSSRGLQDGRDARWLEAVRAETMRLVATQGGEGAAGEGDAAPLSLEALHRAVPSALWLAAPGGEAAAVASEAEALLRELRRNVEYVLDEEAREEKVSGNDAAGSAVLRDAGNLNKRLADFVAMTPARVAELTWSEVAALRLYTSSTFRLINGPLRAKLKPHPLAATTMLVSNALKKMRANHMDAVAKFRPTFLWRGMRDMAVEENFLLQGGTELACMSSSASLAVVGAYAASCTPLLFRIKVDSPMEQGADVSWVSLYPGEAEYLYPPLTFVKPLFVQDIKDVDKGRVVTVKPSFPS